MKGLSEFNQKQRGYGRITVRYDGKDEKGHGWITYTNGERAKMNYRASPGWKSLERYLVVGDWFQIDGNLTPSQYDDGIYDPKWAVDWFGQDERAAKAANEAHRMIVNRGQWNPHEARRLGSTDFQRVIGRIRQLPELIEQRAKVEQQKKIINGLLEY